MIKKFSKVFIFTILAFFIFLATPTLARTVSIDELGELVDEMSDYEPDYIYVIGNYVFTQDWDLSTQDVMLSARSIGMTQEYNGKNKDTALGEMTIYRLDRKLASDYITTEGWTVEKNLVGSTELKENDTLDIRYIDYKYVKELYTVTFKVDDTVIGTVKVQEGEKIVKEKIPVATKEGYQFKGWILEKDGTPYDVETEVNESITLKAIWYEEVDTDKLLSDAAEKINSTDYGAKFENGVLTYNIYDINKKSKDITETGLVGGIRDILKMANVESLTVAYGNDASQKVTLSNSEMVDGENSQAYLDLQNLLSKITNKNYEDILQGDLVDKELTLTVTLNEENARSKNGNTEEQYTVKFVYNPQATISEDIPQEDIEELEGQKWNYIFEDRYDMTLVNGVYNVTGYVAKQEQVTGFGENPTGFYMVFNVKPDSVTENTEILIPDGKGGYNKFTKSSMTNDTLTVIFEVEKQSDTPYFDIIVDIDGEVGTQYAPTKIRIDYTDLKFEDSSRFALENVTQEAENKLKTDFGWNKKSLYTATVTINSDKITATAEGFIPVYEDAEFEGKLPFGNNNYKYYLAFVVKTVAGKQNETTVKFVHKDGVNDKVITANEFDTDNEIYILKHLNPEDENKTFDIVVDIDGDGEGYAPYTVTVDWSNLKFQNESTKTNAEIMNESADDVYGYDFENAGAPVLEPADDDTADYKLTGTVKQQTVSDEAGFSESEGYYVVLKVYGPSESEFANKWTVQFNNEDGTYMEAVKPDYEKGYATVLIKLKDALDADKKIKYKVDFDGAEDNYLPYEETIDYSELRFLEARKVTFGGLADELTVWDEDVLTADKLPTINAKDVYHSFAHWNTQEGNEFTTTTVSGDIALEPHWNLYSDDFMTAVINDLNSVEPDSKSGDFHEKFILEKNKDAIKIKVVNPETPLTEMNNTSIPSAIAFALLKGEITEITFQVNETNKVTFNNNGVKPIAAGQDVPEGVKELTKKIQDGIKALYDAVLGENQDVSTSLSQIASGDNASFKIIISAVDNKKVTLANKDESNAITEYTFTFESTVAVVENEAQLNNALSKEHIDTILIKQGFQVEKTVEINASGRKITIKPLTVSGENPVISDKEQTTEGDTDTRPVFKVVAGDITFENLKIKGATRAISILSGAKVTANKVEAIDSQDTGFDVAPGGTFVGIDLKYTNSATGESKESYHYPTVCGSAGGSGSVTLQKTNVDGTVVSAEATAVSNYQRIKHRKDGTWQRSDFTDPETGEIYPEDKKADGQLKDEYEALIGTPRKNRWDELTKTNHKHYYLDKENSTYCFIYFRDGALIGRYFAKGDTFEGPTNYGTTSSLYRNVIVDTITNPEAPKTYVQDGWSRYNYKRTGNMGQVVEYYWNQQKAEITSEFFGNTTTLYPRYVEGCSVTIEIEGDIPEAQKTIKRYGVISGKKSINDLINDIPEFKTDYQTLQSKEAGEQKIIDSVTQKEIQLDEKITTNIVLVVGKPNNAEISIPKGEYEVNGNKISGLLTTQSDGKYYLPVKITSEDFEDEKTMVTVTDPNGHKEEYIYSAETNDGIATVSNVNEKTMTLQLEAIKASNIASGNKAYEIAVDLDGKNENVYAIRNYTIDYNGVKTAEEVINEAAANTQNTANLTVVGKSKVREYQDDYEKQYDKDKNIRLLTFGSASNMPVKYQYTFSENGTAYVPYDEYHKLSRAEQNKAYTITVAKKDDSFDKTSIPGKENYEADGYYLNGWQYIFKGYSGFGISEVELLRDIIRDLKNPETNTYALESVVDKGDNTYEVTVSKKRFDEWLNTNYADFSAVMAYSQTEASNPSSVLGNVILTVKVANAENGMSYISEITSGKFTVNTTNFTYNDNVIDIKVSDVGTTSIKTPSQTLLGTDTDESGEVAEFVKEAKNWWQWHIEQ